MSEASRDDVLRALTESALRHHGTPKYNEVAKAYGWPYLRTYKLWQRQREQAEGSKGPSEPPPAPLPVATPASSRPPESERPPPPDPAACSPVEFAEWRVRDLAFDIAQARRANSWPAVAGLSKQLAEARAEMEAVRLRTGRRAEDLDAEEWARRFALASRDFSEPVWLVMAQLLEEHIGVRLLVPRPGGGACMVLGADGWEPSGPSVPWSDALRLQPEGGSERRP